MVFVKHDFKKDFGIVGGTFGIVITLEQGFEVELFDKGADAAGGMVDGKLWVDFFSTRLIDNQASETGEGDCGVGSCGVSDFGIALIAVWRWE